MREWINLFENVIAESEPFQFPVYKNPDKHRLRELVDKTKALRPKLLSKLNDHNPDEIYLDEQDMLLRGCIDEKGNIYLVDALTAVHSMLEDKLEHDGHYAVNNIWIDNDGILHYSILENPASYKRWQKRWGQTS